ncbi:MAG: hypothetical protein KGJ06_07280 [Pseudomonadota bacterium]|nr:hypothetical protein [Pseudomonadota bacterium]
MEQQTVQWGVMPDRDGNYRYETLTRLSLADASELQEKVAVLDRNKRGKHETVPFRLSVVGVDSKTRQRQYQFTWVTSEQQFGEVFPDAQLLRMNDTPSQMRA